MTLSETFRKVTKMCKGRGEKEREELSPSSAWAPIGAAASPCTLPAGCLVGRLQRPLLSLVLLLQLAELASNHGNRVF